MFDVGFTELLLIGVVSLVVIGPERLPAVARTVGQYVGKLQRFVTGVKRDIRNELESGELKELLGDQKQQIDELRKMVNTTRRDLETGTRDVVTDAKRKFAEIESSAKAGKAVDDDGTTGATPTVSLAKGDASSKGADARTPAAPADVPAVSMTDRVPGTPAAPAPDAGRDAPDSRASGG